MINSCVENVGQYIVTPQDELHWLDFFGLNKHPTWLPFYLQSYTNISIFKFLKNCLRWELELKSIQKSMFYERSTPMWNCRPLNSEGTG